MNKKALEDYMDRLTDRICDLEDKNSHLQGILVSSGLLQLHTYRRRYHRDTYSVRTNVEKLREEIEMLKKCLGIKAVVIPARPEETRYIKTNGGQI